jgi:acyl-CoA thioesterase
VPLASSWPALIPLPRHLATQTGPHVPITSGDVTGFTEETAVVASFERSGRYEATFGDEWWGPRAPQGGIVAATTLRAMTAELANPAHRLRTSTTVFARTVPAGRVAIDVEVLRAGRSVSQVQGTVHGYDDAEAGHRTLAVFGRERTGWEHLEFTELQMPDVPAPEACDRLPEQRPEPSIFDVSFWRNLEAADVDFHYRWEQDWSGGHARGTRWIRYVASPHLDDGTIDPLAYLPLVDVIPGAVSQRLGPSAPQFFAPTLDLTVHFLDRTDDDWMLQVMRMRRATHGYGSGEMELWSRDGRLLAHASQTMFFSNP